ncbi:MAG TPA: hypothetical protein VK604_16145 [Bryobacteraceae bacterium]|nr:hypothetical protein [Bryobacteraceae bacterium]
MISTANSSADDARHLADLFASMAQDVDDYRGNHLRELTPTLRAKLEDAVQQLDDAHDNFTSATIRKTLDEIADDLDEISAITTLARQAVKQIKNTAKVANVAASVAALALAITSADYGAVPSALEDVTQALKQPAGSQTDDD